MAVASGGGVGWDAGERVASAKIVPGADLSYEKVAFHNPEVRAHFKPLSHYISNAGFRFGPDGAAVRIALSDAALDKETMVNAFEIALPSRTQTIYVVPPQSIEPGE